MHQSYVTVLSYGKVCWYSDAECTILHRTDGPAVTSPTGTKWYSNGVLHRTDGPAVTSPTGTKWYSNGVLHRTDGPAVIDYKRKHVYSNWYLNGLRHRVGGPAIERVNSSTACIDGTEHWVNGILHRTDGPAIWNANGDDHYYINGERMSKLDYTNRITRMLIRTPPDSLITIPTIKRIVPSIS